MSVQNENATAGEQVVLERPETGSVYASLFEKINLSPVSQLSALEPDRPRILEAGKNHLTLQPVKDD